jgi:hypothetical protein
MIIRSHSTAIYRGPEKALIHRNINNCHWSRKPFFMPFAAEG